jgi:hypothetical protein
VEALERDGGAMHRRLGRVESSLDVGDFCLACSTILRERLADPALSSSPEEKAPACTGLTARWCPRCGTCSCPIDGEALSDFACPLHGVHSKHADSAPAATPDPTTPTKED